MLLEIIKKIPTKLSIKEQEIYDKEFWMFFTVQDFKRLFRIAQYRVVSKPQVIFKQGATVDELYYVHITSKGSKPKLYYNEKGLKSVNNGDWISVYDCFHNTQNIKSENQRDKQLWNVTFDVTLATDMYYVEIVSFSPKRLDKLLHNRSYGRDIKQSLEAYWFYKRNLYLQHVSHIF